MKTIRKYGKSSFRTGLLHGGAGAPGAMKPMASALARELHDVNMLGTFFDIIYQDPVISQSKLIAEPWDVGEGGTRLAIFHPDGLNGTANTAIACAITGGAPKVLLRNLPLDLPAAPIYILIEEYGSNWKPVLDTSKDPPNEIADSLQAGDDIAVEGRSVVILQHSLTKPREQEDGTAD